MSIDSLEAYKARLSANDKKRRVALDFMQTEEVVASNIQLILAFRPFPIHRFLGPGGPKFEEAKPDKAALQNLNMDVFLDDILDSFAVAPINKFLEEKIRVIKQDIKQISNEPFDACKPAIDRYSRRYPKCAMPEGNIRDIDKTQARSLGIRQYQTAICELLDKKHEEVERDWRTAFRSAPHWKEWGGTEKTACIPSKSVKDFTLFAIDCMKKDAHQAIAMLQCWSCVGHAITQREAWLADGQNREMFDSSEEYTPIARPSSKANFAYFSKDAPKSG